MRLIAALVLLVPLSAQESKIAWRPAKDYDAALAESKKYGMPVLVYLTAKSAPGVADYNKALADDAVAGAAGRFIPVIVDLFNDKAVYDKLGTKLFPILKAVSPDGAGEFIFSSKPEKLAATLHSLADKFSRGPKWMESVEAALAAGREERKLVMLVFIDESPKWAMFPRTFGDAVFKDLFENVAAVDLSTKKDAGEAKRWKIPGVPAVLLIDATADEPKVLKTLTGDKSPKELKKEIEEALKKLK